MSPASASELEEQNKTATMVNNSEPQTATESESQPILTEKTIEQEKKTQKNRSSHKRDKDTTPPLKWSEQPKRNLESTLKPNEIPNIRDRESALGKEWCGIFEIDVEFKLHHYITAMSHLIENPNINSTVILRADIMKEFKYVYNENSDEPTVETYINENPEELLLNNSNNNDSTDIIKEEERILTRNLDDLEIKKVPLSEDFKPSIEIVRRMIPRNPSKDYIINQTCLILNNSKENSTLIVYTPHISNPEEVPFYLPEVQSIGLLYQNNKLSIHYLPFPNQSVSFFKELNPTERAIRIAYRLLNTAKKHSNGVMNGYQKRVNHDLVVSKVSFQDRYIALKQKYAKTLVDNWCESTDPRKHVFEDIAIAAFLIEFWNTIYESKESFEFRDLGCGNGLLVHILIMEGYRGIGIDARARKSWLTYPADVQARLKEQVIIPAVLLRPHPAIRSTQPHQLDNGLVFKVPLKPKPQHQGNSKPETQSAQFPANKVQMVECYTSAELLSSPQVNTTEFPKNTFIIGNHSDELTCWIPLFGYPFIVIPCCSHNLNGEKARYASNKHMQASNKSTSYSSNSRYASLVDHVEEIATTFGWKVEREMLRIPSTRNAAVIGYQSNNFPGKSIYEIMAMEGGADRWVENTMALMKKPPRDH
ncbi:hypothetical protein CANARDRAFT_26433 [[Candida] arabinofermentans NRRL YB-2248]|uniref:tRNA (uracil-O(2)-)-methyltransferase n=1 Tax=[Candida] arabinofermentans NRRL YB-2248 TaxID=983967 RepID=A0A1E4T953_9ASCO|nr:hypothetical protein CANARDRAFT_26433 [[Candida] arabinofermentans NRRL YB-2248]